LKHITDSVLVKIMMSFLPEVGDVAELEKDYGTAEWIHELILEEFRIIM